MQMFTARSSFNPIIVGSAQSTGQDMLERECKRIISAKEKVEMRELGGQFTAFPYMLRLILTLYSTLSEKLNYYGSESAYFKSPITTHLKYSLLKMLASIIEKRLFISTESPKLYDEMSFSLVFKQCLFSMLLSVLSENSNFVIVERLISFYKNISSEQYLLFLPLHIYHLLGGGAFTIEATVFRTKLAAVIEALGKALATSDTIISRNIESFKGKDRRGLLEESVKVVLLSKNKTALAQLVQATCASLFAGKTHLQKEDFLAMLHNRTIEPILSMLLLLMRSQILLFEDKTFRTNLQLRSQMATTNFYASELAKLFSKCPFNGDPSCSCKKCHCVRRNRESAKISQDRKRQALDQFEAMGRRVEALERREKAQELKIKELEAIGKREAEVGVELEEENLMLRTLLLEMKMDPNIKLLMMQTIEPVSKALNN